MSSGKRTRLVGKILLQLAGMFSCGGMIRQAWEVPLDAGASSETIYSLAAIHSLANHASANEGALGEALLQGKIFSD